MESSDVTSSGLYIYVESCICIIVWDIVIICILIGLILCHNRVYNDSYFVIVIINSALINVLFHPFYINVPLWLMYQ